MSRTEAKPNVSMKRPVVICPGFHASELTEQFVQSVFSSSPAFSKAFRPLTTDVFCANPVAVFDWMVQTLSEPKTAAPVLAIGFSGGVVGLTGALLLWQQQGGQVQKLIAIDGWGMPIAGLPVCRLSHDEFTHWSTLPLGAGKVNFYADPSVDHLQMWGRPSQVMGQTREDWQTGQSHRTSATQFIRWALKN